MLKNRPHPSPRSDSGAIHISRTGYKVQFAVEKKYELIVTNKTTPLQAPTSTLLNPVSIPEFKHESLPQTVQLSMLIAHSNVLTTQIQEFFP